MNLTSQLQDRIGPILDRGVIVLFFERIEGLNALFRGHILKPLTRPAIKKSPFLNPTKSLPRRFRQLQEARVHVVMQWIFAKGLTTLADLDCLRKFISEPNGRLTSDDVE